MGRDMKRGDSEGDTELGELQMWRINIFRDGQKLMLGKSLEGL